MSYLEVCFWIREIIITLATYLICIKHDFFLCTYSMYICKNFQSCETSLKSSRVESSWVASNKCVFRRHIPCLLLGASRFVCLFVFSFKNAHRKGNNKVHWLTNTQSSLYNHNSRVNRLNEHIPLGLVRITTHVNSLHHRRGMKFQPWLWRCIRMS